MNIEIGPEALTDDRPPTLYFKIKTHKPTFITHETSQPEVYTYSNVAKDLTKIARPIINHKNSITTHTSSSLRKLITPIIAESKYLTKDIHETIAKLCEHGPPNQIYTDDIEQFYPNTPHSLVVGAFGFYHPRLKGERHILKRLLDYNYATDGKDIYYLGTTGIPMGLPLAPELAQMCTANLLRVYQLPPNECLTVYFDDVASIYPIDNLPLGPYNLKPSQVDLLPSCWIGLERKDMYFWSCSSMDGNLAGVTTQVGGIAVGLAGISLCWIVYAVLGCVGLTALNIFY